MLVDAGRFTPLSAAERRQLLSLARESIGATLVGGEPPPCALETPLLAAPGAVFVSLHQYGQLRGCIGSLHADMSLHLAVAHMARAAAFDDPRFTPITVAELPTVDIEISRLSPMVPATPEQIELGRHGVCIARDNRRAVFLPKVPLLYAWDRDTFLRELCCKALLPADAWAHPETELQIFEAEVFSDGEEADL